MKFNINKNKMQIKLIPKLVIEIIIHKVQLQLNELFDKIKKICSI